MASSKREKYRVPSTSKDVRNTNQQDHATNSESKTGPIRRAPERPAAE